MIVARFSEPIALRTGAWNVVGSESRTTISASNRYRPSHGIASALRRFRTGPGKGF